MLNDKQLIGIMLDEVVEKRRLDQALTAKEFAVLAGISYSTAREWFHSPGFPVFRGKVFWQDFVQWRKAQIGLKSDRETEARQNDAQHELQDGSLTTSTLPPRAARILSENA